MDWDEARKKLRGLFPDEKERGRVRAKLLPLPLEKRLEYFDDTDAVNKASLLGLAGAGAGAEPDHKRRRLEEPEQALRGLLGPKPTPVPLEQLADFLRDCKNRKLPVSSTVYEELVAVDSAFEELLCPAKGPVAAYMGGLIQNEFFTGGSEQNTVVNSQMHIGNVLWLLAKHAPEDLQLTFDYDRDAATTHSVSSISLLDGCQPNFHAAVLFRLMILGEDQAMEVGMMEAFKYLQKKSMVLNQNQYGPVEYLLSYAACGNRVNFYYNDLAGKVHGLGEQCSFDTATPMHRARLLLFVSNIYRVLLSLSTQLPDLAGATPDNHWQERGGGAAVTRMINKDGSRCFVKKITIAAAKSTMKRLQISKAAFDLVHTLGTNNNGIVKVLRRHSTRTVHTFNMTELGPDLRAVPPSTEQMLPVGLGTLHTSSLGYRDPKEENVVWLDDVSRSHAVLCDLETAGPLDVDLTGVQLFYWDDNTLDNGMYTQHSDLYQLALMLSRLSCMKAWEASSKPFREAMKSRKLSAHEMLQHAYVQS